MGGLDPWASGGRLGRIDVRVGGERCEFLVVLRDTPWGFAVELRRLVAHAAATRTADLDSGTGRIGPYHLERRRVAARWASSTARAARARASRWR